MKEDKVLEAILSIIEKDLKHIAKLLPSEGPDFIKNQIEPKLNEVLSTAGFVSKSKYDSLKAVAANLEKRIEDLEKKLELS
jgi:polyhydroxyalkanoate synthesis regulator phasin|tara:strand:+ start:650 stop:892 length:243 start_codon:yes stop_codon:yes gene_type:complete